MIIQNAKVYTEAHRFEKKNLKIEGERIAAVTKEIICPTEGEIVFDAAEYLVIPGLVDIHSHGAVGCDYSDGSADGILRIAAYEAENGVLCICPTTMSLSDAQIGAVMEALRQVGTRDKKAGIADIAGIHLEGPFLSDEKAGAQNRSFLKNPDSALLAKWDGLCGGKVRLVSVAPELPGAIEFIDENKEKYHISIAHTTADYKTTLQAFLAGADHITHLYNGMSGIGHRAPGPVIAALDADAYAEIICDGIHVHPAMIRTTFRLFGADRVVLISDSMRACGLGDGEFDLGGQRVAVQGNKAVLSEDKETIAGSVTNLFTAMKLAIEYGVPAEDAVRAATENPARSIGMGEQYGCIKEGAYANLLFVDDKYDLCGVMHRGVKLEK